MEKIYLDPKSPGGLGGVERFRKETGLKRSEAVGVLEGLDAYTINRQRRKKFKRNRIVVINMQQQYQMDLADLCKYARVNDGVRYLLVVIDCFSKKASVQPLTDKKAPTVLNGLKKVFNELGEPEKLQSDKGKEFSGAVKEYCKSRDIILFTSENSDIKCSLAENLIKNLKSKIWHLFRRQQNTRYIDELPNIVHAYNHSVHSAIGMRPVDVDQSNSLQVFQKLYGDEEGRKAPKFKVGDKVRIAKEKGIFEKGYEYNFHEEIYTVVQVVHHPVPVYKLKDESGEPIIGNFYEQELSFVRRAENRLFTIDRILRTKGDKAFVSWLGYDKKYNSWIDKSEIVNYA